MQFLSFIVFTTMSIINKFFLKIPTGKAAKKIAAFNCTVFSKFSARLLRREVFSIHLTQEIY